MYLIVLAAISTYFVFFYIMALYKILVRIDFLIVIHIMRII